MVTNTLGDSNRVILAAAPAQPDTKLPTEAELLAIFARAKTATVAAYVDSTSDAPLLAKMPTPGKIVSEKKLPETDIIEWTLSNGARMLLKPTDFKADEVLFAGQSPGGSSLLADKDDLDATFGGYAISSGGLGSFNDSIVKFSKSPPAESGSSVVSSATQSASCSMCREITL